jgi:predicted Zn-dependent protease
MTAFEGHYFDGRVPVDMPAQLAFAGETATLTTDDTHRRFDVAQLMVSPRIGPAERFILTPDGGQFLCADHAFFDRLHQESWSEGPVAWLEARWWAAVACIAMVAVMLLAGYLYGLPAAADRVVEHIPLEAEQALGKQVMAWLEKEGWLASSRMEPGVRTPIVQGFEHLIEDLPRRHDYQLRFYASSMLGANAFALPGGIIVVTDDLVNMAGSTEEVLAVLAHEIGHQEERHLLKGVLQDSVVAVVITAITSDASSLSAAVTGLPVVLVQMKYSRKFEAAADDFAFDLLKRKGYSPAAFATMMERLAGNREMPGVMDYLSSHPQSEKRAQRARDAARLQKPEDSKSGVAGGSQ